MTVNETVSTRPPLVLNIKSLDLNPNPPTASTSNLPLLNFSIQSKRRKNPPPSLILQPASPATIPPTPSIFSPSLPSPVPIISNGGLVTKRQINKKHLSLVLKDTSVPATLVTPSDPSRLDVKDDEVSSLLSRSLPSSPISLSTFIGVEGVEPEDRTIGRLMMKQRKEEADEMREQMKGGIKRRTSIPRLNLTTTSSSSSPAVNSSNSKSKHLGSTNGGSAVKMIKTNSTERVYGSDRDEVEEAFPYENGPREILKGIWLGSEQNARDPKVLRDWGITHVLNVAKEVICPWDDEVILEELGEEEEEDLEVLNNDSLISPSPISTGSTNSIIPPLRHRRTKVTAPLDSTPSIPLPSEPHFVRPTTSTPNLKSVFKSAFISPPPPPLPPLPASLSSISNVSTLKVSTPTTASSEPIRFPLDSQSGRPALNWLWLKWSHDESNLVESHKLDKAFDFIDRARLNEKNNILIHCQCGVSRSATVVIAFCMREAARALEGHRLGSKEETEQLKSVTGMHEAYSFVKDKSAFIGPNLSLVFQLVAYERVLRGAPPLQDDDDEDDDEETSRDTLQTDSNSRSTNSPRTPTSEHESIQSSATFSSGSSEGSHITTPAKLKILPIVKIVEENNNDYLVKEGVEDSPLQDEEVSSRPQLLKNIQSEPLISIPPPIEISSLPSPPRRQQTFPPLPALLSPGSSKVNHLRGKSASIFFPFSSTSTKSVSTTVLPLLLREDGGKRSTLPEDSSSSSSSKLFGGATKDERRASHRRVFSLEGFNLFKSSPSTTSSSSPSS